MEKVNDDSLPPIWQKMRVASTMVASIVIPLVLALVGQSYTAALKQNEIGARYVDMAITILKEPPGPENTGLRRWAIGVINYNSQVPLTAEASRELEAVAFEASVLF